MNNDINTPIYLDLGSALAAFGLIFAVYQLRKSQWDVVLKIRNAWQRNLFWVFGAIGLVLTFVRVLISESSVSWLPFPLCVPLFYEISAYLFFVFSPLSLIYYSTRTKGLFCQKTAERFYQVIAREVSKTNNNGTMDALEILATNFTDICKTAYDGKNTSAELAARSILEVILSDQAMAKLLTTKRLDVLQFIFFKIKEHKISQRESGVGVPKLVQNLFYDKESFFYKHLERGGLALSSNIFETIFDSSLILKNFDLFGYPTIEYSMRKGLGVAGVSVFIEALSRAIKTYLKTGDVPPRYINNGLSHLSDIFGDLCLTISIEEKRGVDTTYSLKDEWWSLHLIANFLGHTYPFLGDREKLNEEVAKTEKTALHADFHSDTTINSGISAVLYKAFEQLSYIESTTDIYNLALDLLRGIIQDSDRKEGYRLPFEKRMWEQIGANVIGRYYPAALKSYLAVVGYYMASAPEEKGGWIWDQAKRMKRLFAVDLKPLLEVDTEMVNKEKMRDVLLPQSMNYENGNFIYVFGFGKGEKRIIQLPTNEAKSALEGVDLKHRSLL